MAESAINNIHSFIHSLDLFYFVLRSWKLSGNSRSQ